MEKVFLKATVGIVCVKRQSKGSMTRMRQATKHFCDADKKYIFIETTNDSEESNLFSLFMDEFKSFRHTLK